MANQRSQLIVKQAFQYSMIMEVMLAMFILVNIIILAGYLIVDLTPDTFLVKQVFPFVVVALELIGFFVIYKINVKTSHRIAGPVFVIERSLQQIEQGDLNFTLNLRKEDYFHEVTDQLNTTVNSLHDRIQKAQQLASVLQKNSHDVKKMSNISSELVEVLSWFKTQKNRKI
ncbi:MAG: methyl-accepting chemotaxis protein [Gammaproteobacteria bacterium]|nr:methyl-accepting chemotaxis protein [Gammaproteobacteria bacterium]